MARVLVVDDEIEMREMLEDMVSEAGHEVCAAANGKEALKKARKQPFDLVITDIVMPKKDGTKIIQELLAKQAGVKIIAVSGGDGTLPEDGYLGKAKFFGAHELLAKPFTAGELYALIDNLLGRP